jgi:hypothetical protein
VPAGAGVRGGLPGGVVRVRHQRVAGLAASWRARCRRAAARGRRSRRVCRWCRPRADSRMVRWMLPVMAGQPAAPAGGGPPSSTAATSPPCSPPPPRPPVNAAARSEPRPRRPGHMMQEPGRQRLAVPGPRPRLDLRPHIRGQPCRPPRAVTSSSAVTSSGAVTSAAPQVPLPAVGIRRGSSGQSGDECRRRKGSRQPGGEATTPVVTGGGRQARTPPRGWYGAPAGTPRATPRAAPVPRIVR